MRAARFYGGKDIRIETLPDPQPGEREVMVEVKATGVCGSDLHGYHVQPTEPLSPRTGGHELAGRVAEIGAGVTRYAVGDRVVVEPTIPCNECPDCLTGNYNLCPQLVHIGGHRGGGFAEYVLAPEGNVYALPDNLSFEEGALAEVYAVAVHTVSLVPVRPGDHVAIIGSGPIGLSIAQMASQAGAASVAVLGKPQAVLDIAQNSLSAVPIHVDQVDPVTAVRQWSQGRGASAVFEAVGGSANTLMLATEIAAKRGRVCMVGGHTTPLPFNTRYARGRELTITWSFCYGRRDGKTEFQLALDLMAASKLDAQPLITHRFPLEATAEAFATAAGREEHGSVKVLVLP